jgi:hypothetical protein
MYTEKYWLVVISSPRTVVPDYTDHKSRCKQYGDTNKERLVIAELMLRQNYNHVLMLS